MSGSHVGASRALTEEELLASDRERNRQKGLELGSSRGEANPAPLASAPSAPPSAPLKPHSPRHPRPPRQSRREYELLQQDLAKDSRERGADLEEQVHPWARRWPFVG